MRPQPPAAPGTAGLLPPPPSAGPHHRAALLPPAHAQHGRAPAPGGSTPPAAHHGPAQRWQLPPAVPATCCCLCGWRSVSRAAACLPGGGGSPAAAGAANRPACATPAHRPAAPAGLHPPGAPPVCPPASSLGQPQRQGCDGTGAQCLPDEGRVDRGSAARASRSQILVKKVLQGRASWSATSKHSPNPANPHLSSPALLTAATRRWSAPSHAAARSWPPAQSGGTMSSPR